MTSATHLPHYLVHKQENLDTGHKQIQMTVHFKSTQINALFISTFRINEGSLGKPSDVTTGDDGDENEDDSSSLGACGGQSAFEGGSCDQGDFPSPVEEAQGPTGGPRWSWNAVQEKDPERYLHRIRHWKVRDRHRLNAWNQITRLLFLQIYLKLQPQWNASLNRAMNTTAPQGWERTWISNFTRRESCVV